MSIIEAVREATRLAIYALAAHGPCTNNSCRECGRAWEKLHAILAALDNYEVVEGAAFNDGDRVCVLPGWSEYDAIRRPAVLLVAKGEDV